MLFLSLCISIIAIAMTVSFPCRSAPFQRPSPHRHTQVMSLIYWCQEQQYGVECSAYDIRELSLQCPGMPSAPLTATATARRTVVCTGLPRPSHARTWRAARARPRAPCACFRVHVRPTQTCMYTVYLLFGIVESDSHDGSTIAEWTVRGSALRCRRGSMPC